MPQLFTNNARALLASGITDTDTSLTVEASKADLFPTANTGTGSVPSVNNWYKATLQDSLGNVEIVYVRTRNAGSGVFSNVLRAQEGTTARSFPSGTVVGLRITAADVEGSIAAAANSVQLTGDQTIAGTKTFSSPIAGSTTTQVSLTGNQTISGSKSFSGSIAVGGSSAPAVNLDVQTTGSAALTSLFTTGITDVNFRVGAMSGVTGGTAGTNMGRLGLFYLGTGEVATVEFRRGSTSTDGSFAFRTSGSDRATLDNSGNFTATGNVTAYSDIRLKKDLDPIREAMAKVKALTGYTYTRVDTGERQTGLVAQDVQQVLPEAVIEGEHMSVAYGNLMGLVVEAIKELEARVKELEGR